MQSSVMKRRRQISVHKIRLALITIVAAQFPNLLCLVTSQIASAISEDGAPQNFQDIDFSNISALDLLARKAMKRLHDDLDHDDDGNVSLSEGAKFIHREDFVHSGSSNLPGFATDKDGRITETEFWDTWARSAVHNWTVAEMIDWVSIEVDLPQYAGKFKQYAISGAAMPILASNSSIVLSLVDGVKEHRLKLWLKAMEIVLCGYSQTKSSLLKDILVTISLLLALGGIAFGINVRRSATHAMSTMQDKLQILQKEMIKLEEEDSWMKDLSPEEERDVTLTQNEITASTMSLSSDSSLQSRLQEVLDELSDTKALLVQAEQQLSKRSWSPPSRLLSCLKATHQVEMTLHEIKRDEAQKKVEHAKCQFLKLKKKTSIFNSVQLIHSRQVDNFDIEIQTAKDLLREVQRDTHECKKRWMELEGICSYKFTKPSGKVIASPRHSVLSLKKGSKVVEMSVSKSKVEVDSNCNVTLTPEDHSGESSDGLSMKDLPVETVESNDTVEEMRSLQSCPTFKPYTEQRRVTEPIGTSSSAANLRHSASVKPTVVIEESGSNSSDKSRTFPRKTRSPKFLRKKDSNLLPELVREGKRGNSPNRTTSLGPNDLVVRHDLNESMKSVSSHSLPDLTGDDNAGSEQDDGKSPKLNGTSINEEENGKSGKKKPFSNIFKRKKKT